MKLLFTIIFTFTLSLYSHEEHKINENNLLEKNIEGYQKLKISKDGFLSTNSDLDLNCLLYTSPSPRDGLLSRMPSSA